MKTILLSCVAVMLITSGMAQNGVNLKMNLEKNKVYRFRSDSEQTITQTLNGNQLTTESKVNNIVSIRMVDLTDLFLITEVHFDTLISISNTMGKTIKTSSISEGNIRSAETDEVISYIMNQLSKNALYIKIDFSGKVLDILNAKMLSDVILKDTSSITLAAPMASAVKTQIKNMVSDISLKSMVEIFTCYLPGKQVSTGEDWKITLVTNSGGMTLNNLTNYHLDGVSGNSANIIAESNIKAADNANPIESGGAKIFYDEIKGISKSNVVIDIRTGLLVEGNTKTQIAGNLGVSVPGMSMQIPVEIKGTSKVVALQ